MTDQSTGNERWNDPRWQERGSAPSREPGDYSHRYSGDGLFIGGGSIQVPAGLTKKASGGDGGGEGGRQSGSAGDGGDGSEGHFSENSPGGREPRSVMILPSLSELGLERADSKEDRKRAFSKALLSLCTKAQKRSLMELFAKEEAYQSKRNHPHEPYAYLEKISEWSPEITSLVTRRVTPAMPSRASTSLNGALADSILQPTPEGLYRAGEKLAEDLGPNFHRYFVSAQERQSVCGAVLSSMC